MKLIVGLGNPGKEYEKTRHNVGFLILDALREKLEAEEFHEEKRLKALLTKAKTDSLDLLLAKPLTYMNKSGEAVQKILHFYKLKPQDLVVVYDDLDLSLDHIRVRQKGSAGTHNGMKSIVASLGTDNFPRVRVGIESRGETAPIKQDLASFVLSTFTKKDGIKAKKAIEKAADAIITMLTEGIHAAMNRYNT